MTFGARKPAVVSDLQFGTGLALLDNERSGARLGREDDVKRRGSIPTQARLTTQPLPTPLAKTVTHRKDEMKNTFFLALIILAVIPASAQEAAGPERSANVNTEPTAAKDYAARVDGLLRDVHASLQNISEGLEAGRLTPEQAQRLKLAATRDMISRLDAMAAVYDERLELQDKAGTKTGSATRNASGTDKATQANTNCTVSVEELKREAAAALVTPRAAQVIR